MATSRSSSSRYAPPRNEDNRQPEIPVAGIGGTNPGKANFVQILSDIDGRRTCTGVRRDGRNGVDYY